MNNGQRWPLYIDGRRYVVEASVYSKRPADPEVLFARVGDQVLAMNVAIPDAGMELEIKVGARVLRLKVNPAKSHLLSLVL